ncbi:interleukin-3-like [Mastomys coucha]|uniref:interleukin-3-like n=1 Tax=Mastomys coucha TaxID=35658 RepID=UPI001261F1B6|nr:interleukin-3-like [Mastomys coucha]
MVPARSSTSILSMLLLLLMLFHRGLQASIRGSDTYHLTSWLNCSSIAEEIGGKLPKSNLTNEDETTNLMNHTLRRVNLYEFLESQRKLDPEDRGGIKSNLQKLKCCLPASVTDSELPGVYNEDLNDFQNKLRFYVTHLNNLQPVLISRLPQLTSGSGTSNPGTVEC